jgi:putative ABC transport system permease protein
MMRGLIHDLRMAVRMLRSAPAVAIAVIASLALTIGANTAIFSILNSLLLRSLPIENPATLVHITDSLVDDTGERRIRAWSYPAWDQFRAHRDRFAGMAAWSAVRFNLSEGIETSFADGLWTDGRFFSTLGVRPVLGRTFTDEDDRRGGGADGPVAVISFDYWQRIYDGAATVLGQTLRLNGIPFTIVGITPPEFFGLEVGRTFDVAVPLATEPLIRGSDSVLDEGASNFLSIAARLKSGQSVDAATLELRRIQPDLRKATLGAWDTATIDRYLTSPFAAVSAVSGSSALRRSYQRPVLILAGVVGFVLLIGCVNVANLLLARALSRRHQVTLQIALGAARSRIVRQLLLESLLLAAVGGVAGAVVARWGSRFLVQQLSTPVTRVYLDLSLDPVVLAFTAGVALFTAFAFGTLPALRLAAVQPAALLQERSAHTGGHNGMMDALVALQVALSMLLLVGGGLFLRSFASLSTRELGFDPDSVLAIAVDGQRVAQDPAARLAVYERLRETVAVLPNVADAAVSFLAPLSGGGFTPAVEVTGPDGRTLVGANEDVFGNMVSARWFSTLGMQILSGRPFGDGDRTGAPGVAIVNAAFVRRFLSGSDPTGHTLTLYPNSPRAKQLRIVGVVADAVHGSPREHVAPTWYVPIAQGPLLPFPTVRLSVKVRHGAPVLARAEITAAAAAVHPQLKLTVRALADQVRGSMTRDRLLTQVSGFFAGAALLLSALGLYGVTAFAVRIRRRELGVRQALGATPASLMRLVLGRVTWLVASGILAGTILSVWAATGVAALLYDVPARDPLTIGIAAMLLWVVALSAGWGPARRAARDDAATAMHELG